MTHDWLAKALGLCRFNLSCEIWLRLTKRENIVGHVQQIAQPSSETQISNMLGDSALRQSFSSINTLVV